MDTVQPLWAYCLTVLMLKRLFLISSLNIAFFQLMCIESLPPDINHSEELVSILDNLLRGIRNLLLFLPNNNIQYTVSLYLIFPISYYEWEINVLLYLTSFCFPNKATDPNPLTSSLVCLLWAMYSKVPKAILNHDVALSFYSSERSSLLSSSDQKFLGARYSASLLWHCFL